MGGTAVPPIIMVKTITSIRVQFFDYLFSESEGYLCICTGDPRLGKEKGFAQHFFRWPEQRTQIGQLIEQVSLTQNIWYCTSLLEHPEREKKHCLPSRLLWADLDTCRPDDVYPIPSCVIESSNHRWQAIWRTDTILEPIQQEDFNKRIAYSHSDKGVDKSGWDLTQLLRVPETFNFKYANDGEEPPRVKLLHALETLVPLELFKTLEPIKNAQFLPDVPLPDLDNLPSPENVIYKYQYNLVRGPFKLLYLNEPGNEEDWSRIMWRLINVCLEAGMSNDEVFAVCITAKCNKYARDNRSPVNLWIEILKADEGHKRLSILDVDGNSLEMPELVSSDEVATLSPCFIDEYRVWAEDATDAVADYHDLAATVLLSSVLASGIYLPTSYGEMVPNIWGLVLGDSTLTRKTTAMRMAMDFITDIDNDMILATDGSIEGILTGLSMRPARTSIFFKDEVSGFFDSLNRKDYLAGMSETFTQLYDVPRILTRRLRKETITITSPIFIFFGGGIRDKVYSLITDEYILSGFLPRFLVVSGKADMARIRPTGPASTVGLLKRKAIEVKIADLMERYNSTKVTKVFGQEVVATVRNQAFLTDDAWARYRDIETKIAMTANDSPLSMVALPTFERLSRSLLKMAVLIAASRQTPTEGVVTVDDTDIIHAAKYVQQWGHHTVDLLQNAGKGTSERIRDKILATIERNPGITRSSVMQRHHLSKREADDILGTLIDRGMIFTEQAGRGVKLKAVG